MSFLNLMRNRLKPKEVNDALTDVQGRVLPATTSASTGQMLGLTGEDKTPAWVDSPEGLPSTSEATTGQILKLIGESKTPSWGDEYSYTPPAYSSTEEVNTGQKWIDGKDIYCTVLAGTTSDTTTGTETLGNISYDKIVDYKFYYSDASAVRYTNIMYVTLQGAVVITKDTDVSEKGYTAILYYTKPNPVPPEAKTRKKTTK